MLKIEPQKVLKSFKEALWWERECSFHSQEDLMSNSVYLLGNLRQSPITFLNCDFFTCKTELFAELLETVNRLKAWILILNANWMLTPSLLSSPFLLCPPLWGSSITWTVSLKVDHDIVEVRELVKRLNWFGMAIQFSFMCPCQLADVVPITVLMILWPCLDSRRKILWWISNVCHG